MTRVDFKLRRSLYYGYRVYVGPDWFSRLDSTVYRSKRKAINAVFLLTCKEPELELTLVCFRQASFTHDLPRCAYVVINNPKQRVRYPKLKRKLN